MEDKSRHFSEESVSGGRLTLPSASCNKRNCELDGGLKAMIAKEEEKVIKKVKTKGQEYDEAENIFSTEEITIEELAIDGICGVY
jgi:mycofactocin precursor